ncbi:DegV family EDD domain-containing protein [candidate division KSB1 bacterium]|nr:DegV family EDD domain-containing protein [candidate division KSB1 bacterium]
MKNKIKYLDGLRLKRSIIASAQRIHMEREKLNSINVFPVADGDTGTNMASTMTHIARDAKNCHDTSIETVSLSIADSALNGARGNSGVILAQFFLGLAEATKGKVRLTTRSFAQAMNNAVERSREAIVHPQEGTILTVMRDWAHHLNERAKNTTDFGDLLRDALYRAKESLADTPKKLQILSKAGVVDAGAQGFVNILEGVTDFIETGKIAAYRAKSRVTRKIKALQNDHKITFRYCTECLLEGQNINRDLLRKKLDVIGDSLIIVGSNQKARIHIHTNEPEKVFSLASEQATISRKKVDDMKSQHNHLKTSTDHIALVTDTTCDIAEETAKKYNIHFVPVIIQVGEKSYKDKTELTQERFYSLLKHSKAKISTSQPSPAFYQNIYDNVFKSYTSALSIHLSGRLSGTLQSGMISVKNKIYENKVHFIDSKSLSGALGLVVEEAALLIEKGLTVKDIKENLDKAIATVRLFIALPSLKYIIRSGRLGKPQGILATLLNIKPVLTSDSDGKIVPCAKTFGKKNVFKKTLSLAMDYAETLKNPVFRIMHANARNRANAYRTHIRDLLKKNDIHILKASPALGVYAGIGAVAIAVIDRIE